MAQIFDLINDIALSYDGDLIIDESQDLLLISGIEWFKREVNKIIRTNLREWRSEPDIGANLEEFIGSVNSKETAESIKLKLLEAITIDNFQFPGQFEVKIIPVSTDKLTIYITYNIIGENYAISKLIYSLDSGVSIPINDELEKEIKIQPQHVKEVKNKYLTFLSNK